MSGHARVYRATGGRIGGNVPGVPSMLLLDHVGAKTGKQRTTPLVYMPLDDDFLVVASKGGYPKDPGWMHNLRAHPETTVQVGRHRHAVRAREATPQERDELWREATAYNRVWGEYRKRTAREIPLVILERV